MYDIFRRNIFEKNLISQGDNVLIGFSGGPDSVFLFHNLRLLKETLSFNLYASHINHMYRGEDADHDENFVRELCNSYGIKLFVKRKNSADYAAELNVTEEEAGRQLRYNFFRENLKEIGGGKIAIAHNLNDQAETVMQRILRGTGIDGLSAMSFKNKDIIRPLLNIKKSEILSYLEKNNYQYCIDKTNLQAIYGRNKIRLNLIPYLEKNFNPNIQNTLFRMAEIMDKDSKIIEKYIELIFKETLVKSDSNKLVLNLNKLKGLEDYEVGRVLRKSIEMLKGNTNNIEMKHIEYIFDFLRKGKTGKTIDISEGYTVEISYDNLIVRKAVEIFPEFKYNILVGEPLFIRETGHTILCKVIDVSEYKDLNKNSLNLDYDLVKGNLTARNRRNGDAMVPCGMNGNKKLKDIFIDMKIPSDDRQKKIIITDESNILWVEGFRIHNDYKISPSTKKIINISITEEHNEQGH